MTYHLHNEAETSFLDNYIYTNISWNLVNYISTNTIIGSKLLGVARLKYEASRSVWKLQVQKSENKITTTVDWLILCDAKNNYNNKNLAPNTPISYNKGDKLSEGRRRNNT
jgi:hypothetical protein